MFYRSVLQQQIDQLTEELTDFEKGRIRVSRKLDGHISWEDATHDMLMRTRARIEALRRALESLPSDT